MTKAEQILRAVQSNRGVTNYELSDIALNYTMRISELRRQGHNIKCVPDVFNGKSTNTYRYYYHSGTPKMKSFKDTTLQELTIARSKGRNGCYDYIVQRIKELS
jgi:hypothetical protein